MIADIVAFWLAGSRDSPDRASEPPRLVVQGRPGSR